MRAAPGLILAGILLLTPVAPAWAATNERDHHPMLSDAALGLLHEHARALLLAHHDAFARGARDPDRLLDPYYHTYVPATHEGGAKAKIIEEYNDARNASLDGDIETAAYELGEMSHMLLDLAQPMHTAPHDAIANPYHTDYENATYDNRDELDLSSLVMAPPLSPADAAEKVARASASRYDALKRDLEDAQDAWGPSVRDETQVTLRDALPILAVLLDSALEPAPAADVHDVGPPRSVPSVQFVPLLAGALLVALVLPPRATITGMIGRSLRTSDRDSSTIRAKGFDSPGQKP